MMHATSGSCGLRGLTPDAHDMEIPLLRISLVKPLLLKCTFTITVILLLLRSCTTTPAVSQESLLPPTDSAAQYFPLATSREDTTYNALYPFINEWYSEMLFALHEPILKDYAGTREIYRFTWLRTFHHPISIRLEKSHDRHRLYVKMTAGRGGYSPGKLITDTALTIAP